MAEGNTAEIRVEATDAATPSIDRVSGSLGKLTGQAQNATGGFQSLLGSTNQLLGAFGLAFGIQQTVSFLSAAAKVALEDERAFSTLRFQVEATGVSFEQMGESILASVDAAAAYARVTDDQMARALQQLIFISGNASESIKNLSIVSDLARQKGIDLDQSAKLVGMAMAGNTELLGRFIPELKNLSETLGKNATDSEKFAFIMAVLQEAVGGGSKAMGDAEKAAAVFARGIDAAMDAIGSEINLLGIAILDWATAGKAFEDAAVSTKKVTVSSAALAEQTKRNSDAIEANKNAVEERTKALEAAQKIEAAAIKSVQDLQLQIVKATKGEAAYLEAVERRSVAQGVSAKTAKAVTDAQIRLNKANEDARLEEQTRSLEEQTHARAEQQAQSFEQTISKQNLEIGKLTLSEEEYLGKLRESLLLEGQRPEAIERFLENYQRLIDLRKSDVEKPATVELGPEDSAFRVQAAQENEALARSYEQLQFAGSEAGRSLQLNNLALSGGLQLMGSMQGAIAQAVIGHGNIGKAVKQAGAQTLAAKGAEAAVLAVIELAYGFALLASGSPLAAAAFKSSAIFASAGGLALAGASGLSSASAPSPAGAIGGVAGTSSGGESLGAAAPAENIGTRAQTQTVNIYVNGNLVDLTDLMRESRGYGVQFATDRV
jgi:hypothetical protein